MNWHDVIDERTLEMDRVVAEVLEGKLVRPEDIKKRVKDWQADHQRA